MCVLCLYIVCLCEYVVCVMCKCACVCVKGSCAKQDICFLFHPNNDDTFCIIETLTIRSNLCYVQFQCLYSFYNIDHHHQCLP